MGYNEEKQRQLDMRYLRMARMLAMKFVLRSGSKCGR
mgnify:CR=1 FL=1